MGTVWLNTSSPAWWKGARNCFTAANDFTLSPDPCPAHQHKHSKKQAGTDFTKESGLALLQNAAVEAERLDQSSEAAMILRRPQIHPYATKMPKPPAQISACGRCFAQFVLRYAAEWAQAQAAARPQPGDAESL